MCFEDWLGFGQFEKGSELAVFISNEESTIFVNDGGMDSRNRDVCDSDIGFVSSA